jgi:hypothetical protein
LVKKDTWAARDDAKTKEATDGVYEELINHQFFSNIQFKISNEIPTLSLNKQMPVRQKLFREMLLLKLMSIEEKAHRIVEGTTEDMTAAQWAAFVINEIHIGDKKFEEYALREGIPHIVIHKFFIWQVGTFNLLISYINGLAMSNICSTHAAKTNTLLYLLGLQLTTIIADAERTLIYLNGELSGLSYRDEILEELP